MKKILFIVFIASSSTLFAQYEKGDWFLNASSSNISFNSTSNTDHTIDVIFTGFRDTLVGDTDSLNLGFLFPYSYKLDQDKQSQFNVNFRIGYHLADKFMFGLAFGYDNETSLFKTNADSKLSSASLTDSLTNVWFSELPDVATNGTSYANHYYELYSLLAASANNDLTYSKSLLSIAPFVRYDFKLRNSNSIFVDASYRISSGKEEMKDAISSVATTTNISTSAINLGVGYCAFLSSNFSIEPQFNYFMYNTSTSTKEETPHPILSIVDMGEKETVRTTSGTGMNFSIGLSYHF
jgi:hypothetical protein